ncbi:MAG: segregation and condensation protein A [Eubacteriales bacterium]
METQELSFKLEVFEGPLDLLLALIAKNKVSIYDIPITLIFDQYMETIDQMQKLDMDVAGEFLEMASRLMLIKSKMLLPKPESEKAEDPRKELVDALLEYRKAKLEAGMLRERYQDYQGRFVKETDEVGIDRTYVCDHTTEQLTKAFDRMLLRLKSERENRTDVPIKTLNSILTRKITPIPEKLFSILRRLRKLGDQSFEDLLLTSETKSDLIASFMAILTLIRTGRISCYGDDENPMIKMNRKESA